MIAITKFKYILITSIFLRLTLNICFCENELLIHEQEDLKSNKYVDKKSYQKFIPNLYKKLKEKENIYILVIGDDITIPPKKTLIQNKSSHNYGIAFYSIFAEMLAKEFLYTGGVTNLSYGNKVFESKMTGDNQSHIVIENKGKKGAFAFDGVHQIFEKKYNKKPDLVIASFGKKEISNNIEKKKFISELNSITKYLKKKNIDIIVTSPPINLSYPHKYYLGSQLYFWNLLNEFAKTNNILNVNFSHANLFQLDYGFDDSGKNKDILELFMQRVQNILLNKQTHLPFQKKFNNHKKSETFNSSAHEYMGVYIYNKLNGVDNYSEISNIISINSLGVDVSSDLNKIYAKFKLKNNSNEHFSGKIFPLNVGINYSAIKNTVNYSLKPQEEQEVNIVYQNQSSSSNIDNKKLLNLNGNQFIKDDGKIHFSFLVADKLFYSLNETTDVLKPIHMVIKPQRLNNIKNKVSFQVRIENRSIKPISLDFKAIWNEQEVHSFLLINPQKGKLLNIEFDLPENKNIKFFKDKLIVNLGYNNKNIKYTYFIHSYRNAYTNSIIPLLKIDQIVKENKIFFDKKALKTPKFI